MTCKRFRVDRGVEGMPVLEEPSVPGETTVELHSVAFEDFFRAEYPALVALAAAVSRSPHTAEDLAQEAMLRARKHWERISAFDKPGTWVRRVTINLALNGRRGLAREAKTRLAWWERRELDEQPQTLDPDLLARFFVYLDASKIATLFSVLKKTDEKTFVHAVNVLTASQPVERPRVRNHSCE